VAEAPRFNEERFRELVLHIAWATRDDPRFGRTRLANVLFYTDFTAYAEEGQPLTGARYEHWELGPFPPALYRLETELQERKLARVERLEGDLENGAETKIVPFEAPNPLRVFEPWELHVADKWVERIGTAGSKEITDLSQRHPGWMLTGEREPIPYETAFIGHEPAPDRAVERGRWLSRELEWS
jgi:hypothetical protein